MTWSFINQIIGETKRVRTRLQYCAKGPYVLKQDLVLLTGLVSLKDQRVFGVYEHSAETEDGNAAILKESPTNVREFCSQFVLPGLNPKFSDVTTRVSSRQFFASLVPFNIVRGECGTLVFFGGSVQTIIAFLTVFFKTRRFVFLQAALYNQCRRRFYISSIRTFLYFFNKPFQLNIRGLIVTVLRLPLQLFFLVCYFFYFVLVRRLVLC